MQFFAAFVFFALSSVQLLQAADLKSILKDCIAGKDIPSSDIALIMDYKNPESPQGQCMVSCIMVKLGYFEADGTIKPSPLEEAAKMFVADEQKRAKSFSILHQCVREQSGSTPCDRGMSAYKCLTGKHLEAGFRDVMDTAVARLMM